MNWVKMFLEKFNMYLSGEHKDDKQRFIDNAEIFIREEFDELIQAIKDENIEEIVDALGDIAWLCDKGMLMVGVDPGKVRAEIGKANLSKEKGIKIGRENALIDVIKPHGWTPPNHKTNHGLLHKIFTKEK